jgi:hypothetical protein
VSFGLVVVKSRVARAAATLLAVALVAAVLVTSAVAATSVGRQTKRQAEIRLLRSTKALAKLSPTFIDPRTRLLRSNTRAVCSGVGRSVGASYHRFRCVVSYRENRLLVAYTAVGRRGWALKKIVS